MFHHFYVDRGFVDEDDVQAPGAVRPELDALLDIPRPRRTGYEIDRSRHLAANPQPLRLGYGNDLRDFRVLADLAGQRTDLTVTGWDVAGKQALSETAGEAVIGGELSGGQSGAAALAAAVGERRERIVHSVPLSSQEARSRAEAVYRGMARRFLTGRGLAVTTAGLRVGATVRLEHLGELFSGSYYLTEVLHLFDGEAGLRTEFAAERAGLGGGAG